MEKIITMLEYSKRIEKRIPAYNIKTVCKNFSLSEETTNKIVNLQDNKSYCLNINDGKSKMVFTRENDTYKIDFWTN